MVRALTLSGALVDLPIPTFLTVGIGITRV